VQETVGQRAGPEADGLAQAPRGPLHEIAEQGDPDRDEHEQRGADDQPEIDELPARRRP
jgi:hypothetical protein